MADKFVEYSQEDGLARVYINRPKKLNALNDEVIGNIEECFSRIEKDRTVKVVIVAGKEGNFAAGADVEMIEGVTSEAEDVERLLKTAAAFDKIEQCPCPVIAAINGFALGGGCELALAADIRYAAENAILGLPEITLGFMPGAGGTQRFPRLVGMAWAKEKLFTGERFTAEEAFRIGLVNKVVPVESLFTEVDKLAEVLLSRPPLALRLLKSSVNMGLNSERQIGLEYERRCFAYLMNTNDKKEGIKAYREKRKPLFKGN